MAHPAGGGNEEAHFDETAAAFAEDVFAPGGGFFGEGVAEVGEGEAAALAGKAENRFADDDAENAEETVGHFVEEPAENVETGCDHFAFPEFSQTGNGVTIF